MLLLFVGAIFVVLILLSMPIVFALAVSGVAGLLIGGYDMQVLSSSMVSGSQSWVLLAIPAFVFAGGLMEKCGMSHALVDFARALVGWVKGGLGMSVIVVAYFFSDICGSKMAEVSALGSTLMPPLTKAGYKREDSASLIAAGTAMGMLVPPAIFMIVIAQVTNTSAVALFLGGFVPAATIMVCLMVLVWFRARKYDWPADTEPSLALILSTGKNAAVPLVIPIVILGGFFLGVFTATEAGAVVAGYAFFAARFYYRNVTFRTMARLAYDSAILTASVIFLLAVASVFQYLMGVSGVPKLLAEVLGPLKGMPWLFLAVHGADHHDVRHGAGGPAGRGRADPGGVPDRREDGNRPHPLQHRADRGGRHRPVPAADGRGAADGAALRQPVGRPALARLHALCRGADGRADADHPVPADLAVPAAQRRPDQVTLTTVSSVAACRRAPSS